MCKIFTMQDLTPKPPDCRLCQDRTPLDFDFSMAFQPIVDARTQQVYAYEALVRAQAGGSAAEVLDRVNDDNRYLFDQTCRVKAVELAARLGLTARLSINFMPNAVYEAATCIRATLLAAQQYGFPTEQLIFEVTENERLVDKEHLKRIIKEYKRQGFKTAIDDFGAGYSGLNLLAEFQPDLIKLDMELTRRIDSDEVRQAIVRGILGVCQALQIEVVAEGIETIAEFETLRGMGVPYMQGYLLARPGYEQLPAVHWPAG